MVRRAVFTLLAVPAAVLSFVGTAPAAAPGPGWAIESFAAPTNFSATANTECPAIIGGGGAIGEAGELCDSYRVTVTNIGSEPTDGAPVTVTDTLPVGLKVQGVSFLSSEEVNRNFAKEGFCGTVGVQVQCHFPNVLSPDGTLTMSIFVTVEGATGGLTNAAGVSGGGAGEASASTQNQVSSTPALFGVSVFSSLIVGLEGAPDTQAGDHPYEFTTRIDLNSAIRLAPEGEGRDLKKTSVHDIRDVVVDLPLGFVGSALSTPTCTFTQLSSPQHCPPDTQIGYLRSLPEEGLDGVQSPLWNMVPERGIAAEFGFIDLVRSDHVIYASVAPTPAGYVLRATSPEIAQIPLNQIIVNLYGDPAARDASGNTPVAQFTNPADCSREPLVTSIHMDSWHEPGSYSADGTPDFSDPKWASATATSPPVTGCDLLQFTGSIGAQPETTQGDTPSGLSVELKVPQSETPGTLATPPLRKAVVTLPAGLAVNPSAAGGLAACSPAQIGLGGSEQPSCPEASKIGTVEVSTPAVAGVLSGSVYLATQNENPFHTLLAGYIVVDDPTTGVLVKIPGRIDPNPTTGQLVATVDKSPQLPFSDLKLHIFGGPRGPLTSTQGATANVSSHFQAANCANLPFHPVFTVSTQAKTSKHNGASLTVKTTYPPGAQANIRSVAVVLPKQLPARLTTIQQACPEATFAQNPASCPAGSDIGIGTASTPVLSSPFTGPAYLVSHGGAAFPDVDIVFQGEGITLVLVGSVNIKHGITSSKFATVPDAPISSFQLSLPEGPHSGLAAVIPAKAKGNMCGQSLSMPFTITGQNGAVLKQNIKIAVTGCPKPKAKRKRPKHGKAKAKKGSLRGGT